MLSIDCSDRSKNTIIPLLLKWFSWGWNFRLSNFKIEGCFFTIHFNFFFKFKNFDWDDKAWSGQCFQDVYSFKILFPHRSRIFQTQTIWFVYIFYVWFYVHWIHIVDQVNWIRCPFFFWGSKQILSYFLHRPWTCWSCNTI